VDETKSSASRRTLKVPDFLIEILARHLETAPESEFVFPARLGGHLRYDNFRLRVWTLAVQRADLTPLTFHELRHTAAAIMIDEGADPLQVQKRLGHKDIRTTYKHYGHLFPNREDQLNEALDRVYRTAKESSSVGFSWDSAESNLVELPNRRAE
jgi:integrase